MIIPFIPSLRKSTSKLKRFEDDLRDAPVSAPENGWACTRLLDLMLLQIGI